MKKILCAILALLMLCMSLPMQAKADTRHDAGYVMPDDVDIWTDSSYIYVSYGEKKVSWKMSNWRNYNVILSKFLDSDGEYVNLIQIYVQCYSNSDPRDVIDGSVNNDNDGSTYNYVVKYGTDGWHSWDSTLVYCYIRENTLSDIYQVGMSGNSTSKWQTYVENKDYNSSKPYFEYVGKIYSTPMAQGKYKVWTDQSLKQGDSVVYPVNYLPAYSQNETNNTTLPYRTTFRMLTDGALTYNTFYYKSSYLSAEDEVSALGTIICDSVKLADGSVSRTTLSAPQLLCQISSYGTAYDIAYTNDDNLCSLLGIEKPAEKVWDVASQTWKSPQGGGGGNNSGGSDIDSSKLIEDTVNVSEIKNLAVKLVGEDALIDAITFNDYYANQVFHENKLENLNEKVWGLGNYITWTYDGVKYENVEDTSGESGTLLEGTKNHRRIKLVVKAKFRIDSSTTKTLTYTLYDYDNTKGIAVGTLSRKISFYDLCLYFQSAYPGYVNDFPTQLEQITYYLTPFYYDKDTQMYHYGSTSRVTQNVKSALADYSGGEWDGDNGGWSTDDPDMGEINIGNTIKGEVESALDSILAFLTSIPKLFSKMLNMISGLITSVGQIPALLGSLFVFLPEEIRTLFGSGLLACVAIGIIRWIKG